MLGHDYLFAFALKCCFLSFLCQVGLLALHMALSMSIPAFLKCHSMSCFFVVNPRISRVTAVHRDQHREPEPERRQAQQDKVVISQEVSKISRRHSFADGFVQARWLCEEQIHPFVQR